MRLSAAHLWRWRDLWELLVNSHSDSSFVFRDPLDFITAVDQQNPAISSAVCFDSYSKRIGDFICRQLGSSKVAYAEKVSLTNRSVVNVLCGLRSCAVLTAQSCNDGVKLKCDTDDEIASSCPAGEVRCGDSQDCVDVEFLCDYETDCPNGWDEMNCPDWLRNFTKVGESELSDSIVEVWTHVPHPQVCAHRCLSSETFECVSFSYNVVARVCALARGVSSTSLRPKFNSTFYTRIFHPGRESISSRLSNGYLELRKGSSIWAGVCSINYTRSNERYVCEKFGYQSVRNVGAHLRGSHWSIECIRSSSCSLPDIHSCTQSLQCNQCGAGKFACASGECISVENVCDSRPDCATGDDEHHCEDIEWRIVIIAQTNRGRLEVRFDDVWQPVCADSLSDSHVPTLCKLIRSRNRTNVIADTTNELNPTMGWRIKCSESICRLDGQQNCRNSYARLQCSSENDAPTCGARYVDMVARDPRKHRYARVVGGFDAVPAAFPWTAALHMKSDHRLHCGASILSDRFLLTAAHCFDENSDATHYEVIVGDWDIIEEEGSEQILNISRIIKYPSYKDLFADDVALVEVNRSIRFGKFVQPICLPTTDFDYHPGRKCVVSGWGRLGEASSVDYPKILQAATIPILNRDECLESSEVYQSISSSAFCAGYLSGGIDTCQGDSGGPFACQIDGNRLLSAFTLFISELYYLAGVISWGDGCALRGRPGIYTMVVPYLSWIKRIVHSTAE
ncbi:unnamed protein product [Anisakis simplex]|uniref:Acrosin (inferred by orthology to a human protein) n=1 Tax=Anisakis simplex TaxID=6269 RepID=A0A0M3JY76_ANISI|nr:unnamed protein product [Anisakis simplex]